MQHLREGASYSALNKSIGIHILNFISITNTDNYQYYRA
nr:hypothetical protein [Rickettsia australis]